MASKSIDIIISTVLKKTGIDAARAAISSLNKKVKDFASGVGRNLTNVKSAFEMVAQGARTFLSAMSKGMEFERMTTQFKSLTGSMELARAHMKDLQDLGRTPPFSLEQFAAASQAMMKMTGGMAGFKEQMQIVGDMAAATGNDISAVGRAFGLAYQVVRDGQPFGRAGQQLYMMGILTKAQVAEFDALSQSGASNIEVWNKLQEVFGRYSGAMAETEKTTKGVVEAIQGEATVAMTEFSSAITDAATPALEGLLGWMKRINEDGTIEEWADNTVDALGEVGKVAKAVGDAFGWFWKSMKTVGAFVTGFRHGMKIADEMGLKGNERSAFARKFRSDVIDEIWGKNQDANEDKEFQRQQRADRKRRKRAEQSAKLEAEAANRIKTDMANAQSKKDKEKRTYDYNEYVKSGSTDAFDTWLENREKKRLEKLKTDKERFVEFQKASGVDISATVEKVGEYDADFLAWKENERRKADEKAKFDAEEVAKEKAKQQEIAKASVESVRKEIADKNAEENRQQSVISNAQTEFDKAFAMYRSEDKGAAQIAEERDYAKDYKQLQKDAARYGGKWRIDELSSLIAAGDTQGQQAKLEEWRKSSKFTPEVESMVRAAAADKTRTTAEDELRKISKNTEDLGKKMEELLSMKG